MTTFTPQQGDYFEVKDLTEEQFEKIVSLYKPYVKTHRATWAAVNHDPEINLFGWTRDNLFERGRLQHFRVTTGPKYIGERLLTYQDVFPDPFPNMHVGENSIGWDLSDGDIPHEDFIQTRQRTMGGKPSNASRI